MTRLLIVGGSDAGIAAALRARGLDASAEVTVVLADRFPNYSICGLPFYLSGEVADWRDLAHRGADEIARHGVELRMEYTATGIYIAARVVEGTDTAGRSWRLGYDKLVRAPTNCVSV